VAGVGGHLVLSGDPFTNLVNVEVGVSGAGGQCYARIVSEVVRLRR